MDVLLTGASGFLGRYIQEELYMHNVITLSRRASRISCDLKDTIPVLSGIEMVVHAAGKAHLVPKTQAEIDDFFSTNVRATQNLLRALAEDTSKLKSFIFISSVAVYGREEGLLIPETHPLLAKDPYGVSKIQGEKLIQEWCSKHNVLCTILRLPLLVGNPPIGNLKSMINAINKGFYFNVANNNCKKSMVLARDVAKIIPLVTNHQGIYNITDGCHPSIIEISSLIAQQLNRRIITIPYWIAKIAAKAGDLFGRKMPFNSQKLAKLTHSLTFDDTKAKQRLIWNPQPVLEGFRMKQN